MTSVSLMRFNVLDFPQRYTHCGYVSQSLSNATILLSDVLMVTTALSSLKSESAASRVYTEMPCSNFFSFHSLCATAELMKKKKKNTNMPDVLEVIILYKRRLYTG